MAKKTIIDETYLSPEELKILYKVTNDPFYFSSFIKVIHPTKGKVRFDLYPFQFSVLYQFLTHQFNIILKFRQAGITELISMYCLWLAMYHPNKKINIISIKDVVAKKVLKKIKFMYKNLPWYLQTPIVNGRPGEYGSASFIEFSNGSFIESIPTSEQAGRSEGLSLLVIDEAAVVKWASVIWASAFPTLSTGGSAIVNSTPYGVGSFYHSTWVDAVMGENPLNPIRLHWQMHPERDEEWYKTMASALGPKRTAQEIDGDFLSSGNTVFDLSDIKAIEDTLPDYQPIKKRMNGKLLIFDEPKDRRYILGADCSTGRSDDYSAFTLGDEFGEEAVVFKGRIPLNKYTRLIGDVGETYNYALLAPETNDIGLTVTTALQDEGYPNLYYSKKLLKKKRTAYPEEELIPGWLTTSKNRSLIIEGLEKDIREEEIIVKDPFFVNEAYTFIYDSTGRPIAMGKRRQTNSSVDLDLEGQTYSDDSIFGKAIYNQVRKTEKPNITTPPV